MIREKIWTRIKPRHFSPVRLSHRTLESFNATFYKNSLFIKINEKRILTKRLDQVTELMKILSLLELFVINIYIYIYYWVYVCKSTILYLVYLLRESNVIKRDSVSILFCFVFVNLATRRSRAEFSTRKASARFTSIRYNLFLFSY